MANDNIGTIHCVFHGGDAFVRENIKGKRYIHCEHCGIIQPTKAPFQQYIEANVTMYGAPAEAQKIGGGQPEKAPKVDQPAPAKIDFAAIAAKAAKTVAPKPATKTPAPAANDDGLTDYEREMGY